METQTKSTPSNQSTFAIGGMACSGCADAVQKALGNIKGVQKAKVNLDEESASVTYDSAIVETDDFKQAVEDAGYEFKGEKN